MMCFLSGKHTLADVVSYWRFHNPILQVLLPHMPHPKHMLSHETVRTVLKMVPPHIMEEFFVEYFSGIELEKAAQLFNTNPESDDKTKVFRETLGFDGQDIRTSYCKGEYSRKKKDGNGVSVYNCDKEKVEAYTMTNRKSNEDSAFVSMLPMLSVKENSIFVADAINTREAVLRALDKENLEYLFPIKSNRRILLKGIIDAFENTSEKEHLTATYIESISGRVVIRNFTLILAPVLPDEQHIFTRTQCLVKYETSTQRVLKRNVESAKLPTTEVKYYICTLEHSQATLEQIVHSISIYWNIQTHHNVLDTVMIQDSLNICDKDHLANRVGINKIIYNILSFRRQCGWVRNGKMASFKSIMEFCKDPYVALNALGSYWVAGAPQAVQPPKLIPNLLAD